MNYQILDLYSDYLLSSFGQTTATGLARLLEGDTSHDQITRMLSSQKITPQGWWKLVKPQIRQMEGDEGVMIIDDSIVEKPYTDENEIICCHYDHAKGTNVKGINFITALYEAQNIAFTHTLRVGDQDRALPGREDGSGKAQESGHQE